MLKTNKMEFPKHSYGDYLQEYFENLVCEENNEAKFVIECYMKLLFPKVSESKYLYLNFNH